MMNEMEMRKKMLEELMGQMDDRQMSRVGPQGAAEPSAMERMEGDMGNLSPRDMAAHETGETPGMENMEEDELTKKLRQASMR